MPNKVADESLELSGLSASIESIAEELRPLYQIENVSDNLAEIASALSGIGRATSLAAIAKYGDAADRKEALRLMKEPFQEWGHFKSDD